MANSMFMYDDVNMALEPGGAFAYAGYVDGRFENFTQLEQRFPGAHFLSIAVSASDDAACLDVEPGDAVNAEVFTWFNRQIARGQFKPCVYTSASNMTAMQATMQANGFARDSYRMWSAHYTNLAHFCGPTSCGFGLTQADATQYTDNALGRSLDESIISDGFFGAPPVPPPVPGKAVQPTRIVGTTRFTNATLTWSGAKDVSIGYTLYLVDVESGKTIQQTAYANSANSGIFVFRKLKENHQYKLGIWAKPGVSGEQAQWVEVTTK